MKRTFNVDSFVNKLLTNCKISEVKEFQADEVITTFLVRRNQFCILLEGEAQLITYDKEGNKKILYYYGKNDIFGEALFKVYMNRELFVLAKKKCKVLMVGGYNKTKIMVINSLIMTFSTMVFLDILYHIPN